MKNRYSAILTICMGFLVLNLVFHNNWMIYTSLSIGLISLISNWASNLILIVWTKIGKILGHINSTIILTMLYYLVLTPIALMNRLFSGPKLILRRMKSSYFEDRNHEFKNSDFEKPY